MLYYFLFPKTLTNSGTTLIRGEGEGIPAKVLFRLFFFENNKSVLTSVLSLQSVSTNFVADCSYIKANQLQWRFSAEFSKVIIRVGGFHIAPNYLALMGKKYPSSGLDDLLVESGVYETGGVSALMKGKAYNWGVRAHKLLLEAFFRLLWKAFLNWCQSSGQDVVSRQRDELSQKIRGCISAVVKKKGVSTSMRQLSEDFT